MYGLSVMIMFKMGKTLIKPYKIRKQEFILIALPRIQTKYAASSKACLPQIYNTALKVKNDKTNYWQALKSS